MEAGKIEWKQAPAKLNEILEQAIAATTSLFENKGIEIIKDIATELPPVSCDSDRIVQVVINLLSNALKFTDKGYVTVTVRRRLDEECPAESGQDYIKVSISDTGIGISEKDCTNVFDKFKQVGDTLTDRPKGSGLGLPICKQIIEYHGGKIWVESNLGKGSVFSFVLPQNGQE
jgi:signal transduction histidine kinase